MTTTQKSLLVTELEKHLNEKDYTNPISSSMRTVYLVDVMSCVRKLDTTKYSTFGELCQAFLMYVLHLSYNANEIHFVFDSYMEGSVKDSERSRRYQNIPIDINMMTNDTPLPVDISSFWVSSKNKEKLQDLLRKYIIVHSENNPDICFIFSASMVENTLIPCSKLSPTTTIYELNVDTEEDDLRLLPRAKYAAENGHIRAVILANDTDIIVAFIYHFQYLNDFGLKG